MGKCEIFKSFRGSAPDPAAGPYSAPRPPAGEGPCCARLVLLRKTYHRPSFPHSSYFGRTSFLFRCYGPVQVVVEVFSAINDGQSILFELAVISFSSRQSQRRKPDRMFLSFPVFGKQTYTREAVAIVFEIFRSITLQELLFFFVLCSV